MGGIRLKDSGCNQWEKKSRAAARAALNKRIALLPSFLVGRFHLGANVGQHLFHIGCVLTIGLKFKIFVERFGGTRWRFNFPVFIGLAAGDQERAFDEVSICPRGIGGNRLIAGSEGAFHVAGVVLSGAQVEVCNGRVWIHACRFGVRIHSFRILVQLEQRVPFVGQHLGYATLFPRGISAWVLWINRGVALGNLNAFLIILDCLIILIRIQQAITHGRVVLPVVRIGRNQLLQYWHGFLPVLGVHGIQGLLDQRIGAGGLLILLLDFLDLFLGVLGLLLGWLAALLGLVRTLRGWQCMAAYRWPSWSASAASRNVPLLLRIRLGEIQLNLIILRIRAYAHRDGGYLLAFFVGDRNDVIPIGNANGGILPLLVSLVVKLSSGICIAVGHLGIDQRLAVIAKNLAAYLRRLCLRGPKSEHQD